MSFILGFYHWLCSTTASPPLYHLAAVYCHLCHLLEERILEEQFLHLRSQLLDMKKGGHIAPVSVL
jgi:hypothetical protein